MKEDLIKIKILKNILIIKKNWLKRMIYKKRKKKKKMI